MCLTYTVCSTNRIKNHLKENGRILAWKIIFKSNRSLITTSYQWKHGWNESSRKSVKLDGYEERGQVVYIGFHVFLKKPKPIDVPSPCKVLPVWCHRAHFVAADYREAVFTKVFVKKADLSPPELLL